MKRLTPDNGLKLGQFYMQGVKEKIKEKDIVCDMILKKCVCCNGEGRIDATIDGEMW